MILLFCVCSLLYGAAFRVRCSFFCRLSRNVLILFIYLPFFFNQHFFLCDVRSLFHRFTRPVPGSDLISGYDFSSAGSVIVAIPEQRAAVKSRHGGEFAITKPLTPELAISVVFHLPATRRQGAHSSLHRPVANITTSPPARNRRSRKYRTALRTANSSMLRVDVRMTMVAYG